ncbi:MAG: 4Fe-4S binding protein [Desulfotignum sp.]|nr:4Fe-4S binding protein [Desulfotignum sp.]
MKWSPEAETAINKVPFFIRKKVKNKVEAYVENIGRSMVLSADVAALKQQFLAKGGMAKQMKGYDISACFGREGCPHAAVSTADLMADLENLVKQADILSFLRSSLGENIKFHHEFRIALCDCPNACSRPQIADIGIMGVVVPIVGAADCSGCNACVQVCPDQAVLLKNQGEKPVIDPDLCRYCGKCIQVCPTHTLEQVRSGFRSMLGGRLGRHPRLALEIPGLYSHDQVLALVRTCLDFYKTHSKNGQRFSQLFTHIDQVL